MHRDTPRSRAPAQCETPNRPTIVKYPNREGYTLALDEKTCIITITGGSAAGTYNVSGQSVIKSGESSATSGISVDANRVISIGKTIAELYYKYEAGEKIEARYPIKTFMINSDNIAEYNNNGWQ